jgi:3-phosphoshikimate 1-carboxyvinyltransferase
MVVTFKNSNLDFHIEAPPSKSIYHRELIVSFLCGNYEHLECLEGDSDDIKATKSILKSLYEVMEGNVPEGK